mmetsp:Transcript_40806/g.46539  ORF Transcript_40806/g.46539 Transcript_40806/m.46539 type:complete len:82 (-) Transcript_40806:15-260(-)
MVQFPIKQQQQQHIAEDDRGSVMKMKRGLYEEMKKQQMPKKKKLRFSEIAQAVVVSCHLALPLYIYIYPVLLFPLIVPSVP